jgi:transcriptional regulator with XRE-family HTH domain
VHPALQSAALMPRPAASRRPAPSAPIESLGRRLARLRKERGFTQVELAKKTDLIQVLISDYENDKLRPNPDVLVRFAVALDVSTDEILGVAKPDKRGPALSGVSRRLLRRLQQFDKLPKRDQDALLRTIDAFLSRGDAA